MFSIKYYVIEYTEFTGLSRQNSLQIKVRDIILFRRRAFLYKSVQIQGVFSREKRPSCSFRRMLLERT